MYRTLPSGRASIALKLRTDVPLALFERDRKANHEPSRFQLSVSGTTVAGSVISVSAIDEAGALECTSTI
jgi:hypothetical protein